MADDNVKPIGVEFREPPGENDKGFLEVVSRWAKDGCDHRMYWDGIQHRHITYYLREGETEVECSRCNTRLDPMFVLRILATEETQWLRNRARYMDEMKRLNARKRTKCWHCGKMTEISRT